MKVAVISVGQMCGKSSLIQILGSVFSRTHKREVIALSTGDVNDNIDIVKHSDLEEPEPPYVLEAIFNSVNSEDSDELFKYGVQAGSEHIYYFDISNSDQPEEEKIEFMEIVLNVIPATLSFIEICGDINSERNIAALEACDVAFIMVPVSRKGARLYKELIGQMPNYKAKINHRVVGSMLDDKICSTKEFASMLDKGVNDILKFPYNDNIPKLSLKKNLDAITYNIIVGDGQVANLRTPLLEMMQYLFDTPSHKVIRGFDKWYK